jgi:hypothetical protein
MEIMMGSKMDQRMVKEKVRVMGLQRGRMKDLSWDQHLGDQLVPQKGYPKAALLDPQMEPLRELALSEAYNPR